MNEDIYKQPLVLFLGAGASTPLEKKTTVQFFEWLKSDQEVDPSFLDFIAKQADQAKPVSVKIDELVIEAYTNVARPRPDVEAVLDHLEKVIEGGNLLKQESGLIRQLRSYEFKRYVKHRDRIKDLVVSHYSEMDKERAFELYRPLIESALLRPLPVFTTNYDLAWEKTYELTNSSSYDLRGAPFTLTDGFSRQRLVTPTWSRSGYEDYELTGADVILFKLHGSVDWVRIPTGAIQRVDIPKRDLGGAQRVIAYPSQLKREIHEEPYRTNYDYLIACLLHAKVCAVIGFSFRDQEIVEEFRQAMGINKRLELMIIDPNAETIIAHLGYRLGFEPKAEIIKQEFTLETAPSIAERIAAKVKR